MGTKLRRFGWISFNWISRCNDVLFLNNTFKILHGDLSLHMKNICSPQHRRTFIPLWSEKLDRSADLPTKVKGGWKIPTFLQENREFLQGSTPQTHVCEEQLGSIRRDEAVIGAPELRSTDSCTQRSAEVTRLMEPNYACLTEQHKEDTGAGVGLSSSDCDLHRGLPLFLPSSSGFGKWNAPERRNAPPFLHH